MCISLLYMLIKLLNYYCNIKASTIIDRFYIYMIYHSIGDACNNNWCINWCIMSTMFSWLIKPIEFHSDDDCNLCVNGKIIAIDLSVSWSVQAHYSPWFSVPFLNSWLSILTQGSFSKSLWSSNNRDHTDRRNVSRYCLIHVYFDVNVIHQASIFY